MKKQHFFIALALMLCVMACKPNLSDGIYAKFETNYGNFTAQLYYKKTPMAVANFVSLAEGNNPLVSKKYQGKKFYDSLSFHRVVRNFVIQGGDPIGNGFGGPGYRIPDEIIDSLRFDKKGVLAWANEGPNTNGSQFFITLAPTPKLNGHYTIFGKIVHGQEIVDSIGKVKVKMDMTSKPLETVLIKHVKIIRKGKDARNFDAPKVFTTEMKAFKEKVKAAKEKMEKELDSLSKGYIKTKSGLRYKITHAVKDGQSPKPGQKVAVFYKGMLPNGHVFDQVLKESGKNPITFPVGKGRVIPGWDEALQLMKVGESARLIIPPYLGYGNRRMGPIPANSILIFDVTLVKIK